MTVITFPGDTTPLRGAFVREVLERRGLPAPAPAPPVERYRLCAWADGYCIRDRGELIATFRGGDSWPLASRLMRLLKADAEAAPEPPEAA